MFFQEVIVISTDNLKNNLEDNVVHEDLPLPEIKKNEGKKKSKIKETFETVFVALLLAVFIRATVAEARYIPSESMVPTLLVKDRLVVEKISNYTGQPKRGDVLVFYPPFGEQADKNDFLPKTLRWLGFTKNVAYIKRVVALPGETVEIKDGGVFINGKLLEESAYIKEKPFYEMEEITVPEGELFVLGDNRNNSMDSHVWGTLPLENVIGHAIIKFWPPQRIGPIN